MSVCHTTRHPLLTHPLHLIPSHTHTRPRQAVETHLSAPNPPAVLSHFYEENVEQLASLTALVRGKLSPLERKVGGGEEIGARVVG